MLKRIATTLLFLLVALCLAPTVVTPFLDRIYYSGPVSDHFGGQRFFNPDAEQPRGGSRPRGSSGMMLRFLRGEGRAEWPQTVPVRPSRPPARVAGSAMRVTWIGHSTVLVQTDGLNILTDPIWSDRASPVAFAGPRRVRAPGVRFEDLPKIDLVLVSHNHYDHMDLATLDRLWRRDRPLIVTSLGNDTILRGRGIPSVARDWGQVVPVRPGVSVKIERVHHWGSRWAVDRNRALWSGFAVSAPSGSIFFAGDTGPGDYGWVDQAARDGPYRLAIIPIGAFLPREVMRDNHIGPVEAVEVFRRLGAARALAVHWGTFQLSNEAIDAPRQLLAATLRQRRIAADRFRATEAGQAWDLP